MLPLALPKVAGGEDLRSSLLHQVQGFYSWVLQNGERTAALQPEIREVEGSHRLVLDTSTFDQFKKRFVASGYFTLDFPETITRYYARQESMLAALPDSELAQMAQDGRGPLMEVEDMDLFFCAQEYEYRQGFVDSLKVTELVADGDTARVIVESPYGWQTGFRFRREDGAWRIRGYCVFE